MIAKRIQRAEGQESSFGKLARYVVNARGQADPTTWTHAANSLLDLDQAGGKVGGVRVTNCISEEVIDGALDILAVQSKNTRSEADKSYHLVISFPVGERPSLAVMHAIEDSLCASIGLADHQRISAIHTDTENLHMHVAINKVHPETFNNIEPYFDKNRLMAACAALEAKHGLQRTNHGLDRKAPGLTVETMETQENDRYRGVDARDPEYIAGLRQSYDAAITEEPQAQSLNAVRTLSSVGVVRGQEQHEVLLPGHALDDLDERRSERDERLRRLRNGDGRSGGEGGESGPEGAQVAPAADKRLSGKAADYEAHSGQESLLGWIQREIRPAMKEAGNWRELHDVLARNGLAITPRGAGMVIVTTNGETAVKASEVGRAFSASALTKRFGSFEKPRASVTDIRAAKTYRQKPIQANTGNLFADYQRARTEAQKARDHARETSKREHAEYKAKLADYYARRREGVRRSTMRPADKMAAYQSMAVERRNDWNEQRDAAKNRRESISAKHPLPVWNDWLIERASTGDREALVALRSRERKKAAFMTDWLRAEDASAAKHVIFTNMKPRTDKAGTVHYEVADGGMVKDMRDGIRVEQRTDAAAFLGLVLASDKFAGQALIVEGSPDFRAQVAKVAGEKALNIVFADAALEKIRTGHVVVAETQNNRAGIEGFIADRNAKRASVPLIPVHVAWSPADSGEAIYEGRRKMKDGTEAILMKKGEHMLVLAVSTAQAAKASTWKVGSPVITDNRGRFVTHEPKRHDHVQGKKR